VRRKNRNSKIFSILELENPSECDGKFCVKNLVIAWLVLGHSEVSLLINFLINGMTRRLVGRPTANPITQPPKNLWRNPGVQPVIIVFIVKVIVESIANVMNNAVNNVEYLRLTFIAGNHPIKR
jgi:hypothetical protein